MGYYDCATDVHPNLALTGAGAIITVSKWLMRLKGRGTSVPKKGRYALKVSAYALGIQFSSESPEANAGTRIQKTRTTKHDPHTTNYPAPVSNETRNIAPRPMQPEGKRLFYSLLRLQIFASLR